MLIWVMEQITPYFHKEGNHTTLDQTGKKLVNNFLQILKLEPLGYQTE